MKPDSAELDADEAKAKAQGKFGTIYLQFKGKAKEAGNYKMGHVKIDGYDVTIENPKGQLAAARMQGVFIAATDGYDRKDNVYDTVWARVHRSTRTINITTSIYTTLPGSTL